MYTQYTSVYSQTGFIVLKYIVSHKYCSKRFVNFICIRSFLGIVEIRGGDLTRGIVPVL
jgi:hypothetical protein